MDGKEYHLWIHESVSVLSSFNNAVSGVVSLAGNVLFINIISFKKDTEKV